MEFWIISIFVSATLGLPTTNHAGEPKCEDVFSNNGLNFSTFHVGAAQGLHYLSLEEIRHFFKEDASEENGIPTFNIRLQDYKVQIHNNTPLWGYEDRFDTWALKVMDWFMLNDKDSLYLPEYNTLEKIIHRYHMHEIYQKAAVTYKDLVENPPKDGICPCATDIEENGILADVYSIAGVMQEQFDQPPCSCFRCPLPFYCIFTGEVNIEKGSGPIKVTGNGQTFVNSDGTTKVICPGGTKGYSSYSVTVNCIGKRSADQEVENVATLMDNYLTLSDKDTAERIVTSSAAWTPGSLAGPELGKEIWVPLAAQMTYSLPDDEGIRDFAYFIYCMLNREETPKPK